MLDSKQIRKLQVRSRRRHGLTKKEFYDLTPSEYFLYENDYDLEEESRQRRTARICAVLAEVNRDPKVKKNPFTEDDYLPERFKKETEKQDVISAFRKLASKHKFKRVQ